jgi:cell division protein FtsI (penicillin-binding protein 3)
MARAYATVANGGVAVQPHLVERVGDGAAQPPKETRIMSAQTAAQLNRMLRLVVGEGTGVEAQIPGYVVAGKTGTAAKADPVHGGYSTSRYVGSFVGFAPARHPRVVVLVTVDEPSTIWGGVVAAPAFKEITQFALQYLQVPPDKPAELASGAQ